VGLLGPAERRRELEHFSHFETRPLNPNSIDEIQRVVIWTIEVPDIRLDICSGLY
jgi:hypothetical protein